LSSCVLSWFRIGFLCLALSRHSILAYFKLWQLCHFDPPNIEYYFIKIVKAGGEKHSKIRNLRHPSQAFISHAGTGSVKIIAASLSAGM
jgi:hypothetical protein